MGLKKFIKKLLKPKKCTQKRRSFRFVRGKYSCVDYIGSLSRLSARQITKNATYGEEVVWIGENGRIRRRKFILDAYASIRYTDWFGEPFALVIHRTVLTFEEEFFVERVLAKSPYFQGLVMKSNGISYKKVESVKMVS